MLPPFLCFRYLWGLGKANTNFRLIWGVSSFQNQWPDVKVTVKQRAPKSKNMKFICFLLPSLLSAKYQNICRPASRLPILHIWLNIALQQCHTSRWLFTVSTWLSSPISCDIPLLHLCLLHVKLGCNRHLRYVLNKGIKAVVMLFQCFNGTGRIF